LAGARTPLAVAADDGRPATGGWRRPFVIGLATQLSNPKTAIWYASIFAAFLPAQIPVWMFWAVPPLTFAVEMGWYTIVAVLFSSSRPRAVYLRGKHWIDRVAGGVVTALGGRLIVEALRATPAAVLR
jgi:threonine/homoserine/homoserine lactone efflux protein